MTIDIRGDRRQRATPPTPSIEGRRGGRDRRITTAVRVFAGLATTAGLVLTGLDLVTTHAPYYPIYAVACYIAAAIAGGVLCIRALMDERQAYWRSGQLDGWMASQRDHLPEIGECPVVPTSRLTVGLAVTAGVTVTVGIALAVLDGVTAGMPNLAAYAAAAFVTAIMVCAVLCVDVMMTSRQEFWRRGWDDGCTRGWRGQAPEVDDPLLS